MIGTKIYKEYKKVFTETIDEDGNVQKVDTGKTVLWYDTALYSQAVNFCNETQLATIEDKGEYYEVVAIPVPSLDELKKAKLASLKSTRDTLEVEPIEYNGNSFDYDEKARERLRNKRQEIEDKGGSGTIPWALVDDTEMVIGLQDFININNIATERAELLHFKYRKLKEQVNNATTIEELEEIKWGEE